MLGLALSSVGENKFTFMIFVRRLLCCLVYFVMMYHMEFCRHTQLSNRCEVTLRRCARVRDVGTSYK